MDGCGGGGGGGDSSVVVVEDDHHHHHHHHDHGHVLDDDCSEMLQLRVLYILHITITTIDLTSYPLRLFVA